MTYNAFGFRTLDWLASVAGVAGTNKALHAYVSNNDLAAILASNYFLPVNTEVGQARLKVGDRIMASLDLDSAPTLIDLIVTVSSMSGVTVAVKSGGITGGQTTIADLGGTITGTVNSTLADIAATAAAVAGGSTPSATQVDTGIALAVSTIVTGVNTNLAKLQAKINAILAALEASGHNLSS